MVLDSSVFALNNLLAIKIKKLDGIHAQNLMGMYMKFPDLQDAKIEKKHVPKKNNHTQDSIYVIQQFFYFHGVAGISLFSRKITKCDYTVFLS